jgi:hypothetical protein
MGAVTPSYPQQAQAQASPVQTYNIPPGTLLRVRIDRTVSTKHDCAGERFTATLNAPVIVDGREAVPRRTLFAGHLTNAAHSGRLKGRAVIGLTFDSFTLDKTYQIDTGSNGRQVARLQYRRARNFQITTSRQRGSIHISTSGHPVHLTGKGQFPVARYQGASLRTRPRSIPTKPSCVVSFLR